MTPTTLPTLSAVETIHRAETLLRNAPMDPETRNRLQRLTDATVSFTGYYLRFAEPACRPEQLTTYETLKTLVTQLENT